MEKLAVNASSTTKAVTFRLEDWRLDGRSRDAGRFSRPSLADSCEDGIRYRVALGQR
jgi:hypothetical protein